MKLYQLLTVIVLVLLSMASTQTIFADESGGNFGLFIGSKSLDKTDWDPVDQQVELGLKFDVKLKDSPISLALGTRFGDTHRRRKGANLLRCGGTILENRGIRGTQYQIK
ncbi:MAG: hypothetical protein V1871_03090 [Planctomycetota bacterium]